MGKIFEELVNLLKTEDRAFGIMKDYIKICSDTFDKESNEVAEKILFLLKPVFLREFKRLTKRKLTPADAVITILHRSFEILRELVNEEDDPLTERMGRVKEVIDKIWENIRNRTKKDAMYYYSDLIKTIIDEGSIGKYPLSTISFREKHTKEPLKNPGIRFKKESPNKIIEINLL